MKLYKEHFIGYIYGGNALLRRLIQEHKKSGTPLKMEYRSKKESKYRDKKVYYFEHQEIIDYIKNFEVNTPKYRWPDFIKYREQNIKSLQDLSELSKNKN